LASNQYQKTISICIGRVLVASCIRSQPANEPILPEQSVSATVVEAIIAATD
jgi:hypothetical protein